MSVNTVCSRVCSEGRSMVSKTMNIYYYFILNYTKDIYYNFIVNYNLLFIIHLLLPILIWVSTVCSKVWSEGRMMVSKT